MGAGVSVPAFAEATSSTHEIDIQVDTLSEAMQLLAADTGVQLLYSHDLAGVTGLNPVTGTYTIAEALELLLEGSDLSSGLTKSGVIVISRRPSGEPLKREVEESMKIDRKSLLGAAAAIALGGGNGAVAQEVDGSVEQAPERARTLNKVTVTAERRAESLLDVPIAISAYSGDRLEETGTLTVADLTNVAPSFQFGQDGAVSYIGMRGVSAGLGVIGAEGSVTVSQNGVTLGRLSLWDVDLFDIERVEVLRGPQGVINGRNSTGGAINIYSKLPTDEYEMGLQATFGNYNRFATEGFMSGRIPSTNINGRIAFATDDADGWILNTLLNQKINSKDKVQARATFVAELSDQLDATLTMDAIRDRSVRGAGFDRGRIRADAPGLSEFLGVPGGDVDDLTLELDQLHAFEKDQLGASLKLQYEFGPSSSLTSVTGYVDQDIHQTYDCDGTQASFCAFPSTPAFPDGYGFEVSQFSQEFTFVADLTDRLDLILGGLYLKDESEHFNHFTAASIGLIPDSTQLTATADLESYAAYAQLRYQLNDYVRLAVGARYTEDEKEYSESGQVIFAPGSYTASNSWNAFTPRFAIDIQPNDDLTLFASASRGFRSGGYSITFLGGEDEFDPEFVWNYEAGLKANLFDERASLAVSAFTMDYKNIQQIVFGLNGTGTDTINAAAAEITGAELEFDAVLNENFSFYVSGAWLDATFEDFRTADPIFTELGEFNPATGLNVRDLSGNVLPRAPELKIAIGGQFQTEVSSGMLGTVRADYTWQDEIFFGPYNYDLAQQEAYGLLGLSATLEDTDGAWSATVFARNALDERYFQHNSVFAQFINPTPSQFGIVGAPRTYGVTLKRNF